ncbi:2-amino-3-ketobutyrate coenzyme A ligase, mitochondrial isoform X1 [Odontomachus brunneus]|uniref:2-amino-3-ketobutyrate coenzyme A ligase, mitochondrial isoform X1 n=1 Tax=Odontomachus brunneus TaxID=486640 RepID=UPI0013F270C0|nr:2-amino-3-ketobutyrate coenzyme A ligase, mitochondrial isoform X1 [Odontomachus brunneus]
MYYNLIKVFKFQTTRTWNIYRTMGSLNAFIEPELTAIAKAGMWKNERIITSPQQTMVTLSNGKKALNFCANNYLGLANNEDVVYAAKIALDKYGAGLSSVRFICGTQEIHVELEKKISVFHGREDAILYASCFDANAGIFEALLTSDDAILSDELNHASIIDGIRLCKAKKYRYKHRNMADLENKLQESRSARLRLIASDGVFSMDGTVAPLPNIIELAEKYNAITFIDDCHATGFFGKTGRGTEEYFDRLGSVDIINSTLGKALGGAAGGYTTSKKEIVSLLRQRSRPYLFSNSLPPPVVASASKVMDLIMDNATYLNRLANNTEYFRNTMIKAGFTISGDNHPICPVILGDAKLATKFADKMIEKGIYVVGFSYPVVPKDKARIRVQISAMHSTEDIDYAVNAFIQIGKELAVIQ